MRLTIDLVSPTGRAVKQYRRRTDRNGIVTMRFLPSPRLARGDYELVVGASSRRFGEATGTAGFELLDEIPRNPTPDPDEGGDDGEDAPPVE